MKAYRNMLKVITGILLAMVWMPGCNEQPFIVDVPIRVVSIHPSGGDVPRDVVVEAIFSEQVVAESVKTDDHYYLEDISDPENPVLVDANNEYVRENYMATLEPYHPLAYSTEYRVTLTTDILRDRDWGPLPVEVTGTFRTLDPPPLALASSVPGADSAGVPRDSDITFIFSEPVDCDSLQTGVSVTEDFDPHPHTGPGQREVQGVWACSRPATIDVITCDGNDYCIATFTPTEPFLYSSDVTVTLRGGSRQAGVVKSNRATEFGGQLPDDLPIAFHVEDPPEFYLSDGQPGPDTEGVWQGADIRIVFSEPPDCDSLAGNLTVEETVDDHPRFGADAGTTRDVAGTLICNSAAQGEYGCTDGSAGDPCVVGFIVSDLREWSSLVTVRLHGAEYTPGQAPADRAVESSRATSYGGNLSADAVWSFRVMDPAQLQVSGVDPTAAAEMVNRDAVLSLVFSEPLNCPSVNAVTVVATETLDPLLGGGSVNHTGALTCTGGDPVVSFDPDSTFNYSSQIAVTLKGGPFASAAYPNHAVESQVATTRGGQLPVDFAYSFTALDPPPLLVVNTAPGGFQENVLNDANIEVTFSEAVDASMVDATTFVVEDVTDPGNPVPVTCTYLFSGGDAVVTCDPSVDFSFDATIRVRLTTDIRSAVATSRGGNLPFEVTWTFDVIPVPPIEVVDIVPRDSAQNVPINTTITVVFNQDILQSTLIISPDGRTCVLDVDCPGAVLCGNVTAGFCDPDSANLNVWLNPGATSDVASRLAIGLISYDAGTYTAVFDPAADLPVSTQYTFSIRGGMGGVRGRFGASFMVADFNSNFTTGINQLLATTIPSNAASGVPVTTEVCAVFLDDIDPATINTSSFTLSFTDGFGTHSVPIQSFTFAGVDPDTLEPDLTGTYTNNKVCLVIDPEFWDCHPDARPLLYNMTYQGMLADTITNAGGSVNLVGGYAWSFSTGGPPQVAGAYGENHVVTVDPLDGATDVPVNGSFFVVFAQELDPATVDAARLRVLDDTGASVAATVSTSADFLEAVVTPNSILDYDADYTLVLSGGYNGAWLADGSYLDADFMAGFTTSPPAYASISPPAGEDTYPTAMAPVIFTRDMYFPSLNETSIYAVDNTDGITLQGVVATNTGDRDSAILQIVPAAASGHDVTVFVTTGAEDFRGNPLASGTQVNYPTVGNTPALNARIPDDFSTTDVAPGDGSDVQGDQVFVLTMPAVGANLRGRMLPPTFNTYSIEFLGTGGGAGCPVEPFGSTNTFTIGTAGLPDSAAIRAERKLRTGCGYQLILHQAMFANIYGISPSDDTDVVVSYTGESVPPTLAVADIHADAMGGLDVIADGRNDVWPRTFLQATFSENMDAPTISAATFTLVCGGNPQAGVISTVGPLATFQPLTPLPGGAACTVTLTAFVNDVAGNPLGTDVSAAFTVESTPPTVVATVPPDSAANVPVDVNLSITFSEEVAPSSLTASTTSSAGTIQLWDRDSNTEIYGCISPGSTPEEIVFSPFRDLQVSSNYEMVITTGVADFGQTPLGAEVLSAFTTQ